MWRLELSGTSGSGSEYVMGANRASGIGMWATHAASAPSVQWFWDGGAKPERDGRWRIPAGAGWRAVIRVAHAALEADSCWRGVTSFPGRVGL